MVEDDGLIHNHLIMLLLFCFGLKNLSVWLQGSARRKKKVVHRTATADDKKLQSSLKKLAVNNIAGIEEVHVFEPLPERAVRSDQQRRWPLSCPVLAGEHDQR